MLINWNLKQIASTPIWRSWLSNAIECSSLQVPSLQLEEFDTCICINITVKNIILLFYKSISI